jgi:apolipoprotein N-acyltransferase
MRIIINKNIFLSILAGILISLSYPDFYIPFIYIFGFLIWLNIIYRFSYKVSTINSFLTGFVFSLLSYYWIIKAINYYGGVNLFVSIFLLILFCIFYSIFYFVSIGILLKFLFNRYNALSVFLFPFIWVFIEITREYFPFSGFPWNLAGYMISYIHPLEKLAQFSGVYGLSFLAIFIPSVLFFSYLRKNVFLLITGVLIPLILFVFLNLNDNNTDYSKKYKVAILQGNIEENIKQDKNYDEYITDVYIKLFKKAAQEKTDLIVMPESAVPFFYFSESSIKDRFFNGIKDIKIPIIIGLDNVIYINGKPHLYNSVFLFDENHNLVAFYNKIKLVPFGEYVPFPFKVFSKLFPYLEGWDFESGSSMNTLNYKNFRIIPLVCFEAVFSTFVANFSKKGNLIVNLSNDAWFGNTSAPFQHFEMSRLRAVETGRYLIRATNTGISAIVSPDGKIIKMSELFKRQILTGEVSLVNSNTFWVKYKGILFYCFLTVFVALVIFYEKSFRR